MKKLIAIVLALVNIAVLVGCNNYSFLGKDSGDSATSEIETVVLDKTWEIKFSTINEIDNLPQDEDTAILNGATIGYSSLFYSFEVGMKYYRYDHWSKKYYECNLKLPDGYTDGEIVHYQGGGGSGEIIIYVKALKNDEMAYLSYLFAALHDPLNEEPTAVDELTEEQVTDLFKDVYME